MNEIPCIISTPPMPHGMPLVSSPTRSLAEIPNSSPIAKLSDMLTRAHAGDVIVVTDQNQRPSSGKTYTVASMLHIDEVRAYFYAIFWLNFGALATEEEIFGAVRIFAVDVYFGLKSLIASIDEESESLFLFHNVAMTLLDLDSLENVENVLRSLIACTNHFMARRNYPKRTPLLVLDGICNDRLLILFRETGFTIVVTTRRGDLTEDGAFPGCSMTLEPLLPHDAFEVVGGTDMSMEFAQAPSCVNQLCADYSSIAELHALGAAALRIDEETEAASLLEDMCQKRLDVLASDDMKAKVERFQSDFSFNNSLSALQSTIVSLLCVFNTFDVDTSRWYMTLGAIPHGTIFDLNFIMQLWGTSNVAGAQNLLNYFVMLNIVVEVAPYVKYSMKDFPSAQGRLRVADEGKETYWTSSVLMSSESDELLAKNRFYMLTALQADFLVFLALLAACENDKTYNSWNSWLSLGCTSPQYAFPFHENACNLLESARRACEIVATFLTSKSLLLSLESVQFVLFSAFWRRLEALKSAKLWTSIEIQDTSLHCAVKYLNNRVAIEIELEGEDACLVFMTRACEVLEILEGESHYFVLSNWYGKIIRLISSQPEDKCDFLGKAHAMNSLGKLYCRSGNPMHALEFHRSALTLYRRVEAESGSGRSASVWRRVSASNGIISALENEAYALNVVIKTVGAYSNSAQVARWKEEMLEAQTSAVKMKLSMYGSDSVSLAVSRLSLARLLLADGHTGDAINEFKMAFDVFALRLGTNHMTYNICRSNYGMALVRRSASQVQYEKGVELIQESVIWFLRHGVKWDDERMVTLRSFLPREVASAMESSQEVTKQVEKSQNFLFFW